MPPKKKNTEGPIILTLKFTEECVDEETLARPSGEKTNDYSEILRNMELANIPEKFTSSTLKDVLEKHNIKEYPKNAVCFWCCHPFSWKACSVPISYDTYTLAYTCEGHFCSPECSLAYVYADSSITNSVRWIRRSLLTDMYNSIYKNKEIIPAPSRYVLQMFGGPLDIVQFRKQIAFGDSNIKMYIPPARMSIPTISIQSPLKDIQKHIGNSYNDVEANSNELRIKRQKQKDANNMTIDKYLQSGE
jgi:hypothetical protein